jgi:uncharacterized protein
MEKHLCLEKQLKKASRAAIAFSGGVDSTFLLASAVEALGKENVLAITAVSPYIPQWEIDEAIAYAHQLGVNHVKLEMGIDDTIRSNPEDRCYWCKKSIFNQIILKAKSLGFERVMDGTNFDDLDDYRPGLKALKELDIVSPLMECEITKNQIREWSKAKRLPTWNKPAYACLLTRIPHGTTVTVEAIRQIEAAENILFEMGLYQIRVRSHGDLARIELGEKEWQHVIKHHLFSDIHQRIQETGYNYVTLDLGGYKMGSFNPTNRRG